MIIEVCKVIKCFLVDLSVFLLKPKHLTLFKVCKHICFYRGAHT